MARLLCDSLGEMLMTSEFFLDAITAYRKLLWPDFTEYDGCVFLTLDEAVYRQWMKRTNDDKRQVEATMNHRHIVDLIPESVEHPTRDLVVSFGKLMQELWEAKLRRDFPTRRFKVSFA